MCPGYLLFREKTIQNNTIHPPNHPGCKLTRKYDYEFKVPDNPCAQSADPDSKRQTTTKGETECMTIVFSRQDAPPTLGQQPF
jgi:hypothetical protein